MIGKSVKEYLEQQNCKVAVFDRIADVKKALIGHLPTIVLLDWNTVIENESVLGPNLVATGSVSSWKSVANGAYNWPLSCDFYTEIIISQKGV